ncbi:MAG: hypothetical protein PHX97_02195 [Dehalococcoidales bacterium]|nr:hypothetical protein [Dehalococcoidales bacterium]
MFTDKRIISILCPIMLTIVFIFGVNVMAADDSQTTIKSNNIENPQIVLSLSEIIAMYPMSPEDEAAIVHTIPQVPVIIDGIKYKPEDVTLFNGQRLHFTVGENKELYAFSDIKELEEFLQSQYGSGNSALEADAAVLYEHITYLGSTLGMPPHELLVNFVDLDFNDKASSWVVAGNIMATIWEHIEFGGNSLSLGNGMYPFLALYGFNDKASSAYAYIIN